MFGDNRSQRRIHLKGDPVGAAGWMGLGAHSASGSSTEGGLPPEARVYHADQCRRTK